MSSLITVIIEALLLIVSEAGFKRAEFKLAFFTPLVLFVLFSEFLCWVSAFMGTRLNALSFSRTEIFLSFLGLMDAASSAGLL